MAETYYQVLTAAINDLLEHGYTDARRVAAWQARLDEAARTMLGPEAHLEELFREGQRAIFERLVDRGGLVKYHPGVARFTLERVRPALRDELDRRVAAGINLIKLNREQMMARQRQRFQGWATSLPPGPTREADRRKLKDQVRKPLARLPFEERRVMIDQGHKLVAAVNQVVAQGGGAIAARWRHVHQAGYDARPAHLTRDGQVFLIRGSWALERGLIKPGEAGFTDEVTQPGEEVFCRCSYVYLYHLRQLPPELLTRRGEAELARVRELIG